MTWRNANASVTLANELNKRYPNRDRSSDGTIGDAAHQSRDSDHNPWIEDFNGVGVVRARDIDEDLDGNGADTGADARWLAEHLRSLGKANDIRLANYGYVIYEGQIAGGNPTRGADRWEWRPYSGVNAHRKHVHLSLSRDARGYDSTAPWGIWPTAKPGWQAPVFPGTIRAGSDPARVAQWRMLLGAVGYKGFKVGVFPWSATLGHATKRFQRRRGLAADGIVGPATWKEAVELLRRKRRAKGLPS